MIRKRQPGTICEIYCMKEHRLIYLKLNVYLSSGPHSDLFILLSGGMWVTAQHNKCTCNKHYDGLLLLRIEDYNLNTTLPGWVHLLSCNVVTYSVLMKVRFICRGNSNLPVWLAPPSWVASLSIPEFPVTCIFTPDTPGQCNLAITAPLIGDHLWYKSLAINMIMTCHCGSFRHKTHKSLYSTFCWIKF